MEKQLHHYKVWGDIAYANLNGVSVISTHTLLGM